jgi:serine/threonine protein kinase
VLQRRVALKVLRPNLPTEQAARERFLREARAMAAISHENVITIYQVGEDQSLSFMAMQLLDGETLDKRLDQPGLMPIHEIVAIGKQVASGLAAAHAQGLIHRDVKPSNIWLEAGTNRVKILDFGLAMARDNNDLTTSGFVIGTPSYMSPEQARGELLDGRSDLFSLGTILYRMTAAERPFDGQSAMVIMRKLEFHQPMRLTAKRPDVPAVFSNLVMEMLSKDRKDRPKSAEEVAHRMSSSEMTRKSHLPVAPGARTTPLSLPHPVMPPSSTPPSSAVPTAPPEAPAFEARVNGIPMSQMHGQLSGIYPRPDLNPASITATIRTVPSNQPQPITRLILYLLVAGLMFWGFWYFYLSNFGQLTIESSAGSSEIHLKQQGEIKHIISGGKDLDVRPGVYDVQLIAPKKGYRLSRETIEIRRGVHDLIRVVQDTSGK